MHADIHERAEVDDVAHRAGKDHSLLERGNIEHIVAQHRRRKAVAHVAPRLFKLRDYIAECRLADAYLLGDLRTPLFGYLLAEQAKSARAYLRLVKAEHSEQLMRRAV